MAFVMGQLNSWHGNNVLLNNINYVVQQRSQPTSLLLALLVISLSFFAALVTFLLVALRAWGLPLDLGLAIAGPLSALISYLQSRAATSRHFQEAEQQLPEAVTQQVNTRVQVLTGHEDVAPEPGSSSHTESTTIITHTTFIDYDRIGNMFESLFDRFFKRTSGAMLSTDVLRQLIIDVFSKFG